MYLEIFNNYEEYLKLVEKLKKFDILYSKGKETIGDKEYDLLYDKVEAFEKKYPFFKDFSSSVSLIGPVLADSNKVKHFYPMQSLKKAKSLNEVTFFLEKLTKLCKGKVTFFAEPKIDGVAISLIYKKGNLVSCVTRGDGVVGEDVTAQCLVIKSIPKTIPNKIDYFEVRGELYLTVSDYLNYLKETDQDNPLLLGNSTKKIQTRSVVAGMLRTKNLLQVAKCFISLYAYDYLSTEFLFVNSKLRLDILKYFKFKSLLNVPVFDSCLPFTDTVGFSLLLDEYHKFTGDFNYPVDGIVIKVFEFNQREKLGGVGKYPNWAIAYKEASAGKETKITSISHSISRNGVITPIAQLSPVTLSGSVIQKATLHNYTNIIKKDIRLEDTVQVVKSGEVIPKILFVVIDKRPKSSTSYEVPTTCPCCTSALLFSLGEPLVCSNLNCKEQLKQKLIFFCSKSGVDIQGLGSKVVSKLYDRNYLTTIDSIYNLKTNYDFLVKENGFSDLSVNKILNNINKKKQLSLSLFLRSLSIPRIGTSTANKLSFHYNSLDSFLLEVGDVNSIVNKTGITTLEARSLSCFFTTQSSSILINNLKKLGVLI